MQMKRFSVGIFVAAAVVALVAGPALAYHCPALVKECRTTADIVAKRPGSDKAAVEKARQRCDQAMKLHEAGKHKESMIMAGEAIAEVSKALK